MKFNKKLLVLALAAALPCFSAHAQSAAELQKEIEVLKAQLKMLSDKIEAMAAKPAAVDPQEFNRLVQKIDLAEEDSINAGFKGMKFKGVLDVGYANDEISAATGFDKARGNGGNGAAMFEISKEPDEGIGWMLRLTPLSSTSIVHEASLSVPVGSGSAKIIAGLTPDFSGYELSWGNANPLISNNLLYTHSAATNYMGAGMSYEVGDWTAKWMVGQVDGVATRKAPGFAYRADYSISEYTGLGFSGVHVRTNDPASGANTDLMEIDGYHTRGDLTLQGQFSVGRLIQGALDGSGADARWWGLSGLVGYKLNPRLQAIARFDYINNRANGGGMYYNPESTDALGVTSTMFGPELDELGAAADPSRGANRYALSAGFNYTVNANTQWKTELRFDRSSGYNFVDSAGQYKKGNTTLGTSLVVSF
jgi:hypothetical protein